MAGVLETGYLTYNKLMAGTASQSLLFCNTASSSAGSSCTDVLNGPYSTIPFTDIPLATLGCLAYTAVAGLALWPVLSQSENDDNITNNDDFNRIALTTITTAMGTFSIFLMTLLYGVLQTPCPYCVFSAFCSVMLAGMAWIGGCLPDGSKAGVKAATSGFLASTMAATLLFVFSVDDSLAAGNSNQNFADVLLASNKNSGTTQLYAPPQITTSSSERA